MRAEATSSTETTQQLEALMRRSSAQAGLISFAGGFPAGEAMPRKGLAASASAVLLESGDQTRALQYGWPEGREGLREWIAQRLRARGAAVQPEDVIITAGAQQALSLAAARLLKQPEKQGHSVQVPSRCYSAALSLFRNLGARLVTPEQQEATPDGVYVMPGVDNPSGQDPVAHDLPQLLNMSAPIIADEAYGELRFDARPPPLLLSKRADVYHVGSFSKTVSPGLRIGWLIAPKDDRSRVIDEKAESDLQACSLTQSMLLHWLRHNDYDEHLARITQLYRGRAERLAEQLRKRLPSWRFELPQGGFCVWIDTDEVRDEVAFLRAAVDAGVSYDPGSHFFAQPRDEMPLSVRLCFSNCPDEAIAEGVQRLEKAWSCRT